MYRRTIQYSATDVVRADIHVGHDVKLVKMLKVPATRESEPAINYAIMFIKQDMTTIRKCLLVFRYRANKLVLK